MIPIPSCVVVSSTAEGHVDSLVAAGTEVCRGDVVATITCGGRRIDLLAPRSGRIQGFLARVRQPVATGDAVVWLAPA